MTQATQEPPKDDNTGKLNAGTLREWIKEEISKVVSGGQSTKDTPPPSTEDGKGKDIRAEVQAALGHLAKAEERKNRDERVDKMLEEYEKPKSEAAPVEQRKVEKWMRWGA